MKVDGTPYRTIWLGADGTTVQVIDQTLLPHQFVVRDWRSMEDAERGIRTMIVRGAPLIGAAAAYGMALAMASDASDAMLTQAYTVLMASRPTAVNLRWALDDLRNLLAPLPPAKRADAAYRRAAEICDEDAEICRRIGENGLGLIRKIKPKGDRINALTHCNAGWLATVDWGTALAPIYQAHNAGIPIHVWVDETRPRNQGASLTAWELAKHGVPHTVIADNAGGHLMQRGQVDFCITGTDRTTRRGDVCNKIGTYLKALAAHDNGIPFYVGLPYPTIDWTIEDGRDIPIEERHASEVSRIAGRTALGRGRHGRRAARGQPGRQSRLRRHAGAAGDGADHRARRLPGQRSGPPVALSRTVPGGVILSPADPGDRRPRLHADRGLGHHLPDARGAGPAYPGVAGPGERSRVRRHHGDVRRRRAAGAASRPADRPHRRAHPHGVGLGALRRLARRTRLQPGAGELSLVLGGDGRRLHPGAQHAVQHRASPRSRDRARGAPSPCWPSSAASPRPCSGRCRARSTSPWAGAARCWSMPRSTSSPACRFICWCCRASRRRTISPPRPIRRRAACRPRCARRVFLLLSVTLSSGAFVFTGAMVHMIELMRGLGHPAASAVLLASLIGPSQVTVRVFELLFGHRYSIMNSAVFGSAALVLGLGVALIDGGNFVVALACIVSYGIANGLKAVQRATLPLALFGRGQFGAYMGRLALPQGIVSASAPPVIAAVLSSYGTAGALWLIFAAALLSLVSMILLARLARNVR